ncbi:MAG: mechanosensitive ion channel [Kordiimonadaceae bacterium]|nr:mechanosensitive ion channel [Kordiimonadaceae bacterium]
MSEDITAQIFTYATEAWAWFQTQFLEPERLVELGVIGIAIFIAKLTSNFIHRGIMKAFGAHAAVQKADRRFLLPILSAAIAIMLIWTGTFLLQPFMATYLLSVASSLLTAWLFIRLAVGLLPNREFARFIASAAWGLAALNIMGLLDPIVTVLDSAKLPLGEIELSLLSLITGILSFGFLIWGAFALSGLLERQLKGMDAIPPTVRALLTKVAKIVLVSLAFLISLNATGIDLTALAVFGGALGVGIGFGLQKVVGNFISGIILLIDRSIKPGDVIETSGTYGTINRLGARYTSVITRDGTEYLIPNEDMITQPVVNWSHSHNMVRRRIPVQVAYESDIHKAMDLMVAAAVEEKRVLADPAPRTLMRGFGENGVDLELRMWINDPEQGVSNIASNVMLRIWDAFHKEGIEFPYPQRVVHVKNSAGGGNPVL